MMSLKLSIVLSELWTLVWLWEMCWKPHIEPLSLQRLHQFLQSHFEEKSLTDLCGKLTSIIQLPEESEYSYVMKCIEVRRKVLLASSKSDIKYDKGLMMKLFYRTLERVLLSSYVVQKIKPLLRSSVSDKDLITAVSKAAVSEKERNQELGKKRQLKVYEVGSNKTSNSPGNLDNKVSISLYLQSSFNYVVSTLQWDKLYKGWQLQEKCNWWF